MVKNRKAIKIKNGKAISIGNDLYYMQGPSHELGGIDVGKNLEVEGGEVMQINKDNIKVFSAQPILNGISPAEKILGGGNPNKVFNEQEIYKDRNRLNDDGSIKSSSTGGRDRARLGVNNNVDVDNTFVKKPIIIENVERIVNGKKYSNLTGAEQLQTLLNDKRKQANKPLELVHPEFDIVSGIKSIKGIFDNIIGRKLSTNYAYRRTLKNELEDINKSGVLRIKPKDVELKGREIIMNNGKKITFIKKQGNSHGGKAFSAREPWKGTVSSGKGDEILIGVRGDKVKWKTGHHGSYSEYKDFKDINKGEGLFLPFNNKGVIDNLTSNDIVAFKNSPIFKDRYINIKKYGGKTKKELGGLNRNKDYGSKDKPYPKVKSSDFAGGGRSYPIPTKADAVDALRLAGLHDRSDIRTKVYRKYPELKKRNGGVITINGNVVDKLVATPRRGGLGLKDDKGYDLVIDDENVTDYLNTRDESWRTPTVYDRVDVKPNGENPFKLMQKPDFYINADRESYSHKDEAEYKGMDLYTNWEDDRPTNPSNLKQDVVPYKPVPFLWDDEQYNISGRSFNKANSRNINNDTNGYDPIEELLLQVKELGTDAQGKSIPEGITFASDRTQPNIANFTFGNEKSDKLRERTGFEQSNVYGIPVSTNVTELTPRKGYDTFSPIIESPTKTEKQNTTKAKTTKTYNNRNVLKSSYPRLTRFPSITQAGITIPKTDINNIRLNNFVSQEDANAGLKKEQSDVDDKIKKSRKRNLINDIIGTGANVIGSGLSYANTRRALKNMQAPIEPTYEQPQKLVTDYNINPQLSDIEEQTKQMMDVIGANTATGRARIQRVQRAINAGLSSKNQLRGQKENIETQLKNADIINRQSVNARNIAARNAWQNNVINFQNNIREQLASNRNNLYSGINASIQDMLTKRENRRQYNNTLGIYAATHPNVNRKIFEQYGVEF